MVEFFLATYEDGVLKPHEPLNLLPHSQVRVVVEPLADAAEQHLQRTAAWETIEQFWQQASIDSGGEHLTREQLHDRH